MDLRVSDISVVKSLPRPWPPNWTDVALLVKEKAI